MMTGSLTASYSFPTAAFSVSEAPKRHVTIISTAANTAAAVTIRFLFTLTAKTNKTLPHFLMYSTKRRMTFSKITQKQLLVVPNYVIIVHISSFMIQVKIYETETHSQNG